MHWLAWVCLAMTGVFAAFGWHVLIRAALSATWPTTIGTLLRATVVPGDEGGYEADVAFTYEVDGTQFRSDRLMTIVVGLWKEKQIRRQLRGIRRDAENQNRVRVTYDPHQPSYGILIDGIRPAHVVLCALSNGAFAATIVVCWLFAF